MSIQVMQLIAPIRHPYSTSGFCRSWRISRISLDNGKLARRRRLVLAADRVPYGAAVKLPTYAMEKSCGGQPLRLRELAPAEALARKLVLGLRNLSTCRGVVVEALRFGIYGNMPLYKIC